MASEQLLRTRTEHSGLRIERDKGRLLLRFDSDRDAVQTILDESQPHRLNMENLVYLMGLLMFMPPPDRILLLGVGGGALIHFFRHYLPQAHITAVDYDAQLLKIAHQHLMLPAADENLHYVVADAREALQVGDKYDLIVVDIFSGAYSPGWLLTKETITKIQQNLSAVGAVAYNLLIQKESTFTSFYRQLRQVFKRQTLCLETAEYQNLLIYGFNFTTGPKDMAQWMEQTRPKGQQFDLPYSDILSTVYSINPVDSGVI